MNSILCNTLIYSRCITSLGIQNLEVHQSSLGELDLSGCFRIDGETLTLFVRECTKLKPQKVTKVFDVNIIRKHIFILMVTQQINVIFQSF